MELQHLGWPVAGGGDFDWRGLLAVAAAAGGGRADRLAGAGHRRLSLCLGHLVVAGGAGRAGRQLGGHALRHRWLRYADPLAAVVVSLLILRLTLRLGREAVSVLLDEIPAETRRRLI